MATTEIQQINKKLDELIDFLVTQFEQTEKRFSNLENGQAHIFERLTSLENWQEKANTRFTNLENGQDHILGELKTLNEDKEVGSYRSRRMESWIEKASKKIDLPYHR